MVHMYPFASIKDNNQFLSKVVSYSFVELLVVKCRHVKMIKDRTKAQVTLNEEPIAFGS